MQTTKTTKIFILLIMPLLALSTMPSAASAQTTPTIILTGQMSSTLFPKEIVLLSFHPPEYKAVLGIDVYHVTSPFKFDLLLVYAWVTPATIYGQVFPLGVYTDNELMYNILSQEFQRKVPVVLVKDVEVKVHEKKNDITQVTTSVMTKAFSAVLESTSLRNTYLGETVSMPTPAGHMIEIKAASAHYAFTVGFVTGYKCVCGIGFNTDFTMTIYTP